MASKWYKENLIKSQAKIKWLRMPGGKTKKFQNDITQQGIVPGKLADESQLGGLSSLLQLTKEPIIAAKPPLMIPLKKRYRDRVYDIKPVVEETSSLLPPPLPLPVPVVEVEENDDVNKSPHETSEEEEERLKVWRSHILEENVNTKRTRARACKGERYRQFMWDSFGNRRKNRWELNQDKEDLSPAKKLKVGKTEKNQNRSIKTTKTANNSVTTLVEKSIDLKIESQSDPNEDKSDDPTTKLVPGDARSGYKVRKKLTKHKGNSKPDLINNTQAKDNNDNLMENSDINFNQSNHNGLELNNDYTGFVLLTPNNHINHQSIISDSNGELLEENRKIDNELVGSKKRKARRQEIRRLSPGSTFKGVDVISENDIRKDD